MADKKVEVFAAIIIGCVGVFFVFGMPFFVGGIISELGLSQSQANLVSSAEIAGMEVLRLIAEPTAAAYAFGCDKMSSDENILVADIGGGTFDISLVNFQNKTLTSVIATSGSTLIGGDDFTECLQNMIREDIIANHKDFYEDITTKITLREEAEKVKCALSEQETFDLVLPPLITSNKELIRHKLKISRKEFYEASKDVFLQINDLVKECKLSQDK